MTEESEAPFDAGNADSQKKRNRSLKRVAVERDNALRAMLSTPEARAYLWDFIGACGVFASSCPATSGQLYFAEGQRNAGLRLFGDIPEDLKSLMAAEAKEKTDGP